MEGNIKLIIFDLDGVLVEAKNIHYEALNEALGDKYTISWNEHLSTYDGLKTVQKLDMLTEQKGLPQNTHRDVWERKQKITLEKLGNLKINSYLVSVFSKLSENYKIAVCSNSIRKTVLTVLSKLGLMEYMDLVISNEDVKNSKPHPEMYWKAISMMSCLPEETLIVEDSPYGLLAASRSKSHILRVKNPSEVTIENIENKLNQIEMGEQQSRPAWRDENLTVLIPMAGAGSRFEQAGYTFPKPLIDVDGKPMIQVVTDNLNIDAKYIFIVQKEHYEKYNLKHLLGLITNDNCEIVQVDGLTEGAACTTLLAKEFIDNDEPLVIANSDQFVEWDSNEFMYSMVADNVDGGMLTFEATHPKWSFAKLGEDGFVCEVAEKKPISNIATVGVYYWTKGSDYVKYTEQMIDKDIRTNNEFYVCPVFNEAIQDGKKIKIFEIEKMWGLGTPEDLKRYLDERKNITL